MSERKILIPHSRHDEEMISQLRDMNYEIEFFPEFGVASRDNFLSSIRGKNAMLIIPRNGKIDREVIEAAGPSLRVIATMSVG